MAKKSPQKKDLSFHGTPAGGGSTQRSKRVEVRLTEEEVVLFREAAGGGAVGTFMREAAMKEASRIGKARVRAAGRKRAS